MEKLLLSQCVKRFMDHAIDTVKSMDGAAEHTGQEQKDVLRNIDTLLGYLHELKGSYLGYTPGEIEKLVDPEYIIQAGRS